MHIDSDASDTEGEQNTQTVSGVTYKPRVACLQERRLESITCSTASLLTFEIKLIAGTGEKSPLSPRLCDVQLVAHLYPGIRGWCALQA